MLDHHVSAGGARQHHIQVAAWLVNDRLHPRKIATIAVLLPPVGIRLGESDLVTAPRQVFVAASIISGGAVPVRRNNAGTENKNLH